MKKILCTLMSAMLVQTAFPAETLAPAAYAVTTAGETEKITAPETPVFDAEKFFVVVGTFEDEQYTKLRYFYPNPRDNAGKANLWYTANTVVLTETTESYHYGDILVYDGEPEMTRVKSAPDDGVYVGAYHYTLADETKLTKAGNCTDLLEQREMNYFSQLYDGSGYWSFKFTDENGEVYGYSFCVVRSVNGIDLRTLLKDADSHTVCKFAVYENTLILPLPEQPLDETYAPGDFNKSNTITLYDINAALNAFTRIQLGVTTTITDNLIACGDVDKNGEFDLTDVINILQYYNYTEVLGLSVTWDEVIHEAVIPVPETVKTYTFDEVIEMNDDALNSIPEFAEILAELHPAGAAGETVRYWLHWQNYEGISKYINDAGEIPGDELRERLGGIPSEVIPRSDFAPQHFTLNGADDWCICLDVNACAYNGHTPYEVVRTVELLLKTNPEIDSVSVEYSGS